LHELRQRGVPEEAIVFLTRSESEAKTAAKELDPSGKKSGGVFATLLLPGIGKVFARGFGAAALLGFACAGTGGAMGSATVPDEVYAPTPEHKCSEDVAFFREVLKEGRSLIVVRTESPEIASAACATLDRLGLGMQRKTPARMQTSTRQVGDVIVLEVSGRITLGEGNVMLREIVSDLAEKGNKRIVLSLAEVHYIDSSGLGELVKALTTVRSRGGELRLASLNKRVHDLLEMTKLCAVFDIRKDEASALQSLSGGA
jgi:anti-sigma B factor antagonist